MKKLTDFMTDQLLFLVIYVLNCVVLISFYQMTVGGAEIIYPIMISVFFLAIYLGVRYCMNLFHLHNLDRLGKNAVTISSNVHEYNAAYDTLLAVHARYEQKIAELKHQSTEDKRLISAFIHNLKTPVTVSSIILQRVENGEITGEEAIQGLEEETQRMMSKLNSLLDLQRLTEFKNDYEPKAVNLKEEVTDIINENKSLFIHNRVYPKVEIADQCILTDLKWNRVLVNQIISNAVKYSASDETKYLFFSASQTGEYTNLIIQDQGIGIPVYDLPKIFDAFFTGENGREGYNSSGIGLYLCKQICDSLGHKIQIENDHGCKVTISYLTKL